MGTVSALGILEAVPETREILVLLDSLVREDLSYRLCSVLVTLGWDP